MIYQAIGRRGGGGGRGGRSREEVVCPLGERVWRMERAWERARRLHSVAWRAVPGGFDGPWVLEPEAVVPREPHQGSLDPDAWKS